MGVSLVLGHLSEVSDIADSILPPTMFYMRSVKSMVNCYTPNYSVYPGYVQGVCEMCRNDNCIFRRYLNGMIMLFIK